MCKATAQRNAVSYASLCEVGHEYTSDGSAGTRIAVDGIMFTKLETLSITLALASFALALAGYAYAFGAM